MPGGADPAYAAGLYAPPKPKAACIHGMGGQLLDDHWLAVKNEPRDFPGAEQITNELIAPLLAKPTDPVSEAPFSLSPAGVPMTKDNRHWLLTIFWRSGICLDHHLGTPVSTRLRTLALSERANAIPKHLRPAVVQTQVKSDFPPTTLIHRDKNPLITLEESQTTHDRLQELGVKVKLIVVEGAAHGFMDPLNSPNQVVGPAEVEEKAITSWRMNYTASSHGGGMGQVATYNPPLSNIFAHSSYCNFMPGFIQTLC